MSSESVNILAVPFPVQGRLNPMVQFCTHLATKGGVKVTLVLTESASKSLQIPTGTASLIEVELIPDVIPEGGGADTPQNTETTFAQFQATFSQGLPQVIEKQKASGGITPKVVLYDSILPWILGLAKGFGLQGAALFTQPCCVCAVYYHIFHGDVEIPSENSPNAGVLSFPAMPLMGTNDLPCNFNDDSQQVQSLLTNQFLNIDQVDWIFFNSFDKLEEKILKWMRSKWAVKTIGPLVPSLWVVRESEETKLPKDFKSKISEKGLVVKWCPQLQVLSHGAIACFMTHCGWNSALEALTLGVPMIVVPQWADQPMNAKYVVDVWEIGVRPKANQKGIVTKIEIQACIHEVMEEEKGKRLKRNAVKWKGLAEEALLEGGSSHSTIEHFISHLSSI
ncbi:PREDICTED: UDP-glycosyltransferase 74E1-like isoform X2 [Ipomoea nil]|uniref:UDP-glycosyltransferase 74E1-like isoform X2 n=1 Tax=Ipomoea nil TaxID=35883 RepID=UPI000900ECF2|nr:PREDICTED: UDP-glycosyltransferase 74E1-like isoform X2 [Ipomoea nil]